MPRSTGQQPSVGLPILFFATMLGLLAGILVVSVVAPSPTPPPIVAFSTAAPAPVVDEARIVREAAAVARQGASDQAKFEIQTSVAAMLTAQADWEATMVPKLESKVERRLLNHLTPVPTADVECSKTPQPGQVCRIPTTPRPGTRANPYPDCAQVDWGRVYGDWCRWADNAGTPAPQGTPTTQNEPTSAPLPRYQPVTATPADRGPT